MDTGIVEIVMGVTLRGGTPFIESRARVVGPGEGPIPKGKVLILRTPILRPGASEEEIKAFTERELVEDDESAPLCARNGEGRAPRRPAVQGTEGSRRRAT